MTTRTNYAVFTEQFGNAAWSKVACSIVSNAIIAPDGSLTADKLTESSDVSPTVHVLSQGTATAIAAIGDLWTLSVFAQAAERTQLLLALAGSALVSPAQQPFAIFEMTPSKASVVTTRNGVINPQMIYCGSNWWRLRVTGTALAAGSVLPDYQPCIGSSQSNVGNQYVGNGTSGIYVWGAQLEPGSIATPYIENDTGSALTVSDVATPTESIITGSAMYPIPLQTGVPQSFSIQLGGVTYQMTLLYRNDTSGLGGWTVDIADASGNPMLQGVPLVTGADLLAQYPYLDFGGSLFVQTTSDPDAIPTFANLGGDGVVYWVNP